MSMPKEDLFQYYLREAMGENRRRIGLKTTISTESLNRVVVTGQTTSKGYYAGLLVVL